MNEIIGKWEQPEGQPYPGLWFEFNEDGTFKAALDSMGIFSSGTYTASNGLIDMDQTKHTLGLIGKFQGFYKVEGDTLYMTLGETGGARPASLEEKNKRTFKKI